ncbi:hypothetical protein BWQ96_05050 [Gracilariopsis chorda]|uniref:NOT2/NOT3/NOT5 C-terminal domain-containing protein n=1 Tax=Gracilariopsis chorda TaxID=448386 RepID=A0A2V3ISS3_9FLOR|nr:hypothetical protein BWQ96_05050 [Gracilariopsis chorda]|eukprot:PXF45149.1 hypothetical protein BWQ96_05050 [Gracilariopsis chorda]
MSHLYYTYGAENAASSPPSVQQHPAHRRSPQAWSADPRRPSAQLSLSQLADLSSSPPQSLSTALMNSARPVPPSSRPTAYDDNLFQIMGKGFNDHSQPYPSQSPPLRAPQQAPPYPQAHQPSTVFDPSDFPSLGTVGAHPSIQPSSSSILDTNASIDHTLTNPSLSAPTLNGMPPYQDLYSLGAYADSRVKAVDALTGSSAPSEFSMQSEDFPALGGGASASTALRPVNAQPALANGAAPFQIDTSSMRTSLTKSSVPDSFYDRKLSAVSSQPHSILGRANVRQDASRMQQRTTRLPNGYAVNDTMSAMPPHHPSTSHLAQQQHAFRAMSSTSPRRSAATAASHAQPLFQVRTRQLDVERRPEQHEPVDVREAPSLHNLPIHNTKATLQPDSRLSRSRLPNGQSSGAVASDILASVVKGNATEDFTATMSASAPITGLAPASAQTSIPTSAPTPPSASIPTASAPTSSAPTPTAFPSEKFGMLSLLPLVSTSGSNARQDRVLPIGVDLTALGLNLSSTEPLYKTFYNPWEGGQGKSGDLDFSGSSQKNQEPDFRLPTCYYMQAPALRTNHFTKFQLETLFYIFYIMPHDVLELLAAVELYKRNWRYHKTLKLWFTSPELEKNSGYEGGYIYFDIKSWGKREFHEANQSFIKGFMTQEELGAVRIPPL